MFLCLKILSPFVFSLSPLVFRLSPLVFSLFFPGVPLCVGLSAVSLLASISFRSKKKSEVPSSKSEVRNRYAKDAAAIPNAAVIKKGEAFLSSS